jgi:hypothetical protein
MKTLNQKSSSENIKLNWTDSITISNFLREDEIDYDSIVKPYTIKVLDENNILLKEYNNFKEGEKNFSLVEVALEDLGSLRRSYMFASPRKRYTRTMDTIRYSFTFSLERNMNSYFEKNEKIGFYKKLKLEIISEDGDTTNDTSINVDFKSIDNQNIDLIFKKIFRNIENNGLKFKFDNNLFVEKEIESILIIPTNEPFKNNFKYIFVDDIKNKWLSIIQNETSLSVPFPNSYVFPNSEKLNLKVYYLNSLQNNIFKYLREKNTSDDVLLEIMEEYLADQKIEKTDIQNEKDEYTCLYQNFIYLFNDESFNSTALPSILINDVEFKNYFPKYKNDQNQFTYLINKLNPQNTSVLSVVNDDRFDNLGYKFKDLDGNINDYLLIEDLTYQKNTNIKNIEIKNVIDENDNISIYLEATTRFINTSDFNLKKISNNLSFIERYFTNIDDTNYVTFLFKLNYNYINNNFPDVPKNQLIQNKEFIFFEFEIN